MGLLKIKLKKYRKHFRVWIISPAVFTRSHHLQHGKAQCGKIEPPNYFSWREKYWDHLLLKSTFTFPLIASQVSLVLVCIVQNLHFWSCNIGIWNNSWGRGDGTANVKEPTEIVSAYTATVAEEMIMELYRHHTFLYSSLQEIIIWWRTSVRYWPVVFQCFFLQNLTL